MDNAPYLAPLDKAPSLGVWVFFRLCRYLLGKVMTPARVIYARMPRLLIPQLLMYRLAARGLSLPPLLVHRVHVRVSLRNGCAFCTDVHQAMALRDGFAHDDFAGLLEATEHLEWIPPLRPRSHMSMSCARPAAHPTPDSGVAHSLHGAADRRAHMALCLHHLSESPGQVPAHRLRRLLQLASSGETPVDREPGWPWNASLIVACCGPDRGVRALSAV